MYFFPLPDRIHFILYTSVGEPVFISHMDSNTSHETLIESLIFIPIIKSTHKQRINRDKRQIRTHSLVL